MPDISSFMGPTIGIIVLSVCFTIVVIVASIGIPIMISRSNRKKAEALLASGVQGTAKILGLEDTGMRINDNPRVAILLEMTVPGIPVYQIKKTMTVPMIRMSQVQVGATVAVVVDPNQAQNPDKVGVLLK